eukprot:TRINITY_DN37037_c0_g1_i1.p1 TRINITY_DN37037_c0_g1~~TRINITY_DN37037_c0_g1_i1.p1  ORF type:complete len:603 (+),score=77.85 TRINITY_DN37037_c0_g1_i1:51-1859(+)
MKSSAMSPTTVTFLHATLLFSAIEFPLVVTCDEICALQTRMEQQHDDQNITARHITRPDRTRAQAKMQRPTKSDSTKSHSYQASVSPVSVELMSPTPVGSVESMSLASLNRWQQKIQSLVTDYASPKAVGFICFASIAVLLGATCLCASASSASDDEGALLLGRRIVQAARLVLTILQCAHFTSVIPESNGLIHDIGYGPTASGFLIGSAWVLVVPSLFVGKYIHVSCSSAWCRVAIVVFVFVYAIAAAFFALFANPPAWMQLTKGHRCIGLLISRLIFGIGSIADTLIATLSVSVTPRTEQIPLAVAVSCSATIGLGLGPLLCPFATWALNASSYSARAAAVQYLFATLWAVFVAFLVAGFPSNMGGLAQAKRTCDEAAEDGGVAQEDDCAVEHLNVDLRRKIWFTSLVYGFERALIVSALEAATAFVLEVEFGWSTTTTGLAVGISFLAAVPLALFGEVVKARRLLTPLQLLPACACICCLGSCLLFPQISVSRSSARGSKIVLAADALIFSTGYMSNGIMDGLAYRASDADSTYTQVNYWMACEFVQSLGGRLIGPVAARWLLASHGRTYYAALQFCVSFIGCMSCLRVVRIATSKQGT